MKEGGPLDGPEGLAVYLRYLQETVPDMTLPRPSAEKGESRLADGERAGPPLPSSLSAGSPPGESGSLESLASVVSECRLCVLSTTRTFAVFGEGNPDARLMFVGEGPGADEDASGRPFVGRAGELLTRMIAAMGYRREDVYIANVVKCRPPGNRVPEESERASCLPYLKRQIAMISPEAMVLLGQTAAVSLLSRNEGISRLRGRETSLPDFPGIRVMPTYHPAYLLRNPAAKAQVWEDLKQVMGWLGKERG
ncbi:MAG: uracil-DNA glycosylase [Nitrospirae bacterium]|nr:uracil-DNA glycosylase [Nitrospirota bacterium]